MRAIIIEESRFKECLDLLELEKMKLQDSNTPDRVDWPKGLWQSAVTEAHRSLHYVFVKWAQSQGAKF